jgi:hypothetical protein
MQNLPIDGDIASIPETRSLVEKTASVAVRNCHWLRLRNRDQASATKGPPFSRGSLRTATKGASTWPPAVLRGGGPLVAVLLANRD